MTEINESELRELRRKASDYDSVRHWIRVGCTVIGGIVVFLVGVTFVWKMVSPKLNLYKANTEKQAVIKEAEARSKAAEFEAISKVTQAQANAAAEIERAKGTAEAQRIINSTLTEPYLRYLYIQQLSEIGDGNQVIYIPTEAGLPILEAGRATTPAAVEP